MSFSGKAPLVQTENIKLYFPLRRQWGQKESQFIHAVDDVSLDLQSGECLGLVGESGCGKTTLGRLFVKADQPSAGRVLFQGQDISTMSGQALQQFRKQVQLIYQDPYDALDPRQTIQACVAEPLAIHQAGTRQEQHERVLQILAKVGLSPAQTYMQRYPRELSGGQRQRVAIARALVLNPTLVVADEPTSMLDTSVRAGVLRLLAELRAEYHLALLYITHDLAVARFICDRIAVMYLGKIVELGSVEQVLQQPQHPYTHMLLRAVPTLKRVSHAGITEPDDCVRQAINPPPQCRFLQRCPIADQQCHSLDQPPLVPCSAGHAVACRKVTATGSS